MADKRSQKTPRVLWILMHHGCDGWLPSVDHFCAWRTKKAAQQKIADLGEKGKMYKPFKYSRPQGGPNA